MSEKVIDESLDSEATYLAHGVDMCTCDSVGVHGTAEFSESAISDPL